MDGNVPLGIFAWGPCLPERVCLEAPRRKCRLVTLAKSEAAAAKFYAGFKCDVQQKHVMKIDNLSCDLVFSMSGSERRNVVDDGS
jgi:hypothetical protein